jgi:hypothetical protein
LALCSAVCCSPWVLRRTRSSPRRQRRLLRQRRRWRGSEGSVCATQTKRACESFLWVASRGSRRSEVESTPLRRAAGLRRDRRHCAASGCGERQSRRCCMTKDAKRPSAAMEGKGAYNRHSLIPSAGGALALPHLQRAIADILLGPGDGPVVVADYGSSQGSTRSRRYASRWKRSEPAVASIARSSCIITINRRTISIRSSTSSTRAQTPIAGATRTSSLRDRAVVLRERPASGFGAPRLELLCGDVDQPRPRADPGPFHLRPNHRRGSRRMGTPRG